MRASRVEPRTAADTSPSDPTGPPLAPRNATEDAILEAARELLSEGGHEQVDDRHDRAAGVRQPHDGLLLLREQARGHGPPHPAGVRRHGRGRLAVLHRRRRSADGACARPGALRRRREPQRPDPRPRRAPLRRGRAHALAVGALRQPLHRRRRVAHRARPAARPGARRHPRAGRRPGALRDGRAPPDDRGHPPRRATCARRSASSPSCGSGRLRGRRRRRRRRRRAPARARPAARAARPSRESRRRRA